MIPQTTRPIAAVLVAVAVISSCHQAAPAAAIATAPATTTSPVPRQPTTNAAGIARAQADSARHPYTDADIHFMSAMIGHHAQAIAMANWAPTRGASPSVLTLAARIINSQQDEIVIMQQWLVDRRQPVPDARVPGMRMTMDGHEHMMLMPGMLTDAQMKELEAARGPEFDRLFLTFMIQHHKGAVSMVKDLFSTYGAAQDESVFKFATDVNVDQATEIARMQRMLAAR